MIKVLEPLDPYTIKVGMVGSATRCIKLKCDVDSLLIAEPYPTRVVPRRRVGAGLSTAVRTSRFHSTQGSIV